MKIFYFGCIDRPGHYMFSPNGRSNKDTDRFTASNPWGYKIDGRLCPAGPEVQGRTLLHHKDGWTALSFWDRSVDKRGKCNSNFLAEGDYNFDEMVRFAKEHFPKVTGRFGFQIVDASTAP